MGPLRSGILEMITVSWGPGACALFSAPFCAAVLCANASGAGTATSERASSAKPAACYAAGGGPDDGVNHDCTLGLQA